MTSYLRGLLEMQETAEQAARRIFFEMCEMERADIQADAERNMHPDTRDLIALQNAVRTFAEHQTAANLRALCQLAGVELIEPRPLEIESSDDPIGDMLELHGLSRCCECPLDPDTGWCTACADGK